MSNIQELIQIQKDEQRAVAEMVNSKGWEVVKNALIRVQNEGIKKILETDDENETKIIRSDCRAIRTLLQVIDKYAIIKSLKNSN